jgi:hypothetical protein
MNAYVGNENPPKDLEGLLKSFEITDIHHNVFGQYGKALGLFYNVQTELEIDGKPVNGWLALPLYDSNGTLSCIAFISPDRKELVQFLHSPYPVGCVVFGNPSKDKPIFLFSSPQAAFAASLTGLPCLLTFTPNDYGDKNSPEPKDAGNMAYVIKDWSDAGYARIYAPVGCDRASTYKLWLKDSAAQILPLEAPIDQYMMTATLKSELLAGVESSHNETIDNAHAWGEIQSHHAEPIKSTAYPIEAFPPSVANAIKKSAHFHDVPLAVAGQIYLGEMAFLAQSHIDAHSDKSVKGQPCSLAILTIFPSGDGKDNCINDACKVSMDKLDKEMKRYKEEKAAWLNADPKDRDEPPKSPLNRFKKLSTQGLVACMSKGGTKGYTWTTGEGAYLLSGYNLKSDTVGESLSVINDLIDTGRSNNVIKGLEEAEYLADVRFSLNIAVQNVVAKTALHNDLLREQGFLARFLFSAPEPLKNIQVTKQKRQMKPYHDPDIKAYWQLCEDLLTDIPPVLGDSSTSRYLIVKDDAADDVHIEYENFINQQSEPKAQYALIAAYAKRTKQYVLRVAAILAFFAQKTVIDAEVMTNAVKICTHSLNEWIRYYGTHETTDSEVLLEWLLKQKTSRVLKSSINQNVRKLKTSQLRDAAINHLVDTGHISLAVLGKKEYVVLNPTIQKNV